MLHRDVLCPTLMIQAGEVSSGSMERRPVKKPKVASEIDSVATCVTAGTAAATAEVIPSTKSNPSVVWIAG